MRLTEFEIKTIVESFHTYFRTGNVYLFGSRVDDTKKGGDIDLYIVTHDVGDLLSQKLKMLQNITAKIGEQKIDIVISSDKTRPIEQEAVTKGVKLDLQTLKKTKLLNECDKHLQRLQYAKKQLKRIFPLTLRSYQKLTQQNIQSIDQFIYRFSKLQDTIGEKLLKMVLALYEENTEKFTYIDMLNRIEKADVVTAHNWKEFRDIRNELAHNYEDDIQVSCVVLNKVYEKEEELEVIYENIKRVLKK